MKKIILSIITVLLFQAGISQLKVDAGANWLTTGNASVVLQDMNLVNDGLINGGMGSFRFSGFQNSTISGSNSPMFYILEMAKTNGAKVILNRSIGISYSINFVQGQIELNGNNISLASTAFLSGESEMNRITGANGGYVQIIQTLYTPNMSNPGNLGAFISCTSDLGPVTIRRCHVPQNGTGLSTSINRYYNITPTNNSNLNATLRLKYFDAELNGQNENSLVIYQNPGNGSWNNISRTSNGTNSNFVEKTAIASFAVQTLANDNSATGAVTGLIFTGSRKKPTEVQLTWTSQTETNLNGYQIQRRLDNEIDFTDRAFITSLAPGGNSVSPINYQNIDANAYTGLSYYRLKIIDKNNVISYSNIISVAGKQKGSGGGNSNGNNRTADDEMTATNIKQLQTGSLSQKITVGPNPNNGNFWFSVSGLENETVATLFFMDGKKVSQFRVINMQRQQVTGLRSGVYLLSIPGFETQKIIVNGGGNPGPQSSQLINNPKL